MHWILCGDTNDLKLDSILDLNSIFCQMVQNPTRLNPPRILDPIITTLSGYYQKPICLPPLDADPDKNGKPSDHLMVVMPPISVIENRPGRVTKRIKYRPFNVKNLEDMKAWMNSEDWSTFYEEDSANKKMEILQKMMVSKYHQFFPEKSKTISSDDNPYFTEKLKMLKRRKCREYRKNRKSLKWKNMENKYQEELEKAKKNFYDSKIRKLRKGNPRQWHREFKKLTRSDQHGSEEISIESIKEFTADEQAELIANSFAAISQEFDALKKDDIEVPTFSEKDVPIVTEAEVSEIISKMDPSKSTIDGDVPAKVLKNFSDSLAKPVTNVINAAIKQGCWPDILKLEMVTPVPKKFPPKTIEEMRNISGLLNMDKIAETVISRMMISDMRKHLDPSQFANQKGLSIQHYLVKMIDRILGAVDGNSKRESCAVLATLVDWKQAFPRQCPKLGVESFIKNGVRPSLIPLLISYFQGRKMQVKWHGVKSKVKDLNGGGPQGATFGIWEYLSQSNDNADCISESDKFKFVDDLSFLEIIQLLSVGLASYNIRAHIPSNIPTHNQIIVSENLKSQDHLNEINKWTKNQKMRLNEAKTKNIIFNFSKKYQFTTELSVNDNKIEIVNETRLLGTILTSDLKWDKNTKEIVKNAYKRMQLLNTAAGFTKNVQDLKNIYLTYVRSILEQSAVVWHSSLSSKNRRDLERVQKAAVRVILQEKYTNYKQGLKYLRMDTLEKRREMLCLKFAKKCTTNEKVSHFFPTKKSHHKMKKRKTQKYVKNKARTKRYQNSAIPYMQKLLNKDDAERRITLKC